MHVTVDPLVLLTALAFLVPWAAVRSRVRAWAYQIACHALRLYLQRREGAAIIVYTGEIRLGACSALVQQVLKTRGPLTLVLDTNGGSICAALQVVHALAAHPWPVTVRAPDQCSSAGTIIACAADRIVMGPHAHLSYADAICHIDSTDLRAALVVAADRLGISVDLLRSRTTLSRIAADIAKARAARSRRIADQPVKPEDLRELAERLTFPEADHWEPLFREQARALGLAVEVDPDPRWYRLVYLSCWSHA